MNSDTTLSPDLFPTLSTVPRVLLLQDSPRLTHCTELSGLLVSCNLGQFLQSLSFMIITFLKSSGQLLRRMPLSLDAPRVFPRLDWGYPFGAGTSRKECRVFLHASHQQAVKAVHLIPGDRSADHWDRVPTALSTAKLLFSPLSLRSIWWEDSSRLWTCLISHHTFTHEC